MKGSEFARTTVPVNVHMLSHLNLWMGKEPGQVPYVLFTPPWQSDSGLTRFGIEIYTGSMHPPKRVPYTQLSIVKQISYVLDRNKWFTKETCGYEYARLPNQK